MRSLGAAPSIYSALVPTAFALCNVNATAQEQAGASIEGIWSSRLSARNHEAWKVEDLLCPQCVLAEYRYLQSIVADPKNEQRSLRELDQQATTFGRDYRRKLMTDSQRKRVSEYAPPPGFETQCEPPHLYQVVLAPLPLSISVDGNRVTLRQHHWNTVRTIGLEAPPAPSEPDGARFGLSTARFDGKSLVVETRNVPAVTITGFSIADGTRIVERYTPDSGGARLDVEVTIDDPESFHEPLVMHDARVSTPDLELFEYEPCGDPFTEQ
jgi:hypothetical protein